MYTYHLLDAESIHRIDVKLNTDLSSTFDSFEKGLDGNCDLIVILNGGRPGFPATRQRYVGKTILPKTQKLLP